MKNNNMLCKHPPAVNFLRRYALVILLGLLVFILSLLFLKKKRSC